ncbi:hypothetical protein Cgig2_019238 [Carnegiea gigantea]|uniref:Transposase-associated domain-containing protein n=1 Tax=Carnegiea gigantea TaxID=171969 RepID=A0A9Q1GPZ0_9CARY|nr:hypothetical protein Cgig2_019238 [Carnegiea gigantea]
MTQELDSSWIELPNDHPDYFDGAVKFIKLAKENLVEGRTRCPCRRCKVDKWLPIEEVEQHILFKGFHKEYKHFIFHGKGDILDHVKYRGSTSREITIDPPNFTSGDDMEGLLRAAFGVDMPRCKHDILHDVVDEPLDEEVEPFLINVTANDTLRSDWIINELDGWLQNQVEYIDVSTPEGELRKALADGLNPIAISVKSFITEASAKLQERLLSSSPSKTQVEIENEVFDKLMYEEENPKRPIGFSFNVDRSDVFSVNSILRKRGYIFPDNNMELKRVKEELASQKAMFLLMLKAVHNGKITDEFLDATKAALRMAGDQVPQESSGNNLSNESGHDGPSTSASQVN